MLYVPYAKPNDGILDILSIKNPHKLVIAKVIADHNKGHFEKHAKYFSHKLCKTMTITSDSLLSIEMDGEAYYANEISLKVIPGGIKVFVPDGLDFVDFSYRAYKSKADVSDVNSGKTPLKQKGGYENEK
jgi:diacylglycerol kinase family enzyme